MVIRAIFIMSLLDIPSTIVAHSAGVVSFLESCLLFYFPDYMGSSLLYDLVNCKKNRQSSDCLLVSVDLEDI